jgi:hypothetical protein
VMRLGDGAHRPQAGQRKQQLESAGVHDGIVRNS